MAPAPALVEWLPRLGGKKRSLRALEEATDVEATPRVNKRSDLDLDRTPGKVFGFQKLRQVFCGVWEIYLKKRRISKYSFTNLETNGFGHSFEEV